MPQRYVKDEFWTDPYVEELDPSEKLLFLYLLTNPLCNCAGIYEVRINRMSYEIGFNKKKVEKILNKFVKDSKIIRVDNWIILINFVKNQANNPSILMGVQRILDSLPPACIQALTASPHPLGYYTILNLTIPNGKKSSKDDLSQTIMRAIEEEPLEGKLKRKDSRVWQIIYYYKDQYKYATGKMPVVSGADYHHIRRTLEKMDIEDMKRIIVWYVKVANKKFIDHPSLKSIFTVENINKFNLQ
jgi:hypothetical protein